MWEKEREWVSEWECEGLQGEKKECGINEEERIERKRERWWNGDDAKEYQYSKVILMIELIIW